MHTDLHECLGHGSGKMLPGVGQEALKNYYSTIEEARADLFALYGPETGGVGGNSLVGGGKERILQLYPQRFDGSVDPGEVGK